MRRLLYYPNTGIFSGKAGENRFKEFIGRKINDIVSGASGSSRGNYGCNTLRRFFPVLISCADAGDRGDKKVVLRKRRRQRDSRIIAPAAEKIGKIICRSQSRGEKYRRSDLTHR